MSTRRLEKPSPLMRKVLSFLAGTPEACISVHYHGDIFYYISCRKIYKDGSSCSCLYPPRLVRKTFQALEKRGWLDLVQRRQTGYTHKLLPNGAWNETILSFDLDYRLSPKGRKALENSPVKGAKS